MLIAEIRRVVYRLLTNFIRLDKYYFRLVFEKLTTQKQTKQSNLWLLLFLQSKITTQYNKQTKTQNYEFTINHENHCEYMYGNYCHCFHYLCFDRSSGIITLSTEIKQERQRAPQ